MNLTTPERNPMKNEIQESAIGAEVRDIALDLCIPNPWNKARPVDDAFLESLLDKGQIVIALVRPHPKKEGSYEIIFGERRWEGLGKIGKPTLMAEIRGMEDDEAEGLCAIENAQRAGLTWQQQCELITSYLDRHDDDDAPARIGSALGITTAQVKRRARLLSQLSPAWLQAMKDGELNAWTVDHFEIVAVFDEKFQENLWKQEHYGANGMTLKDLKEEISLSSKILSSAPWDPEDVTLVPKVGACVGCSYRSDAQSDLFGTQGGTSAKASCLDAGCFATKLKAFTKRKESELLEKHPEAVKVAEWGAGPKSALRNHEVTPAKKSDKGAVPAIQYGQGGKVTLGYVKVKKSAKPPTEKSKAKDEAKKQEARITALAIEKLQAIIRDPDTEFTDEAEAVLTQYCLVNAVDIEIGDNAEAEKRIRAFAKKPITVDELWAAVAEHLFREMNGMKWAAERGWDDEDAAAVELAAWMVSADFSELVGEAEREISTAPAPSEEGAVPGTVDTDDLADDSEEDDDL